MRLFALTAALLAAGCVDLVEPINPVAMDPGPAQYAAASHVSGCSGVTVRATDVRWWVVDGIVGDEDAFGAWNPPRDVYLVIGATESVLVSGHELLHHVLGGDYKHRSPLWAACELTAGHLVEAEG